MYNITPTLSPGGRKVIYQWTLVDLMREDDNLLTLLISRDSSFRLIDSTIVGIFEIFRYSRINRWHLDRPAVELCLI